MAPTAHAHVISSPLTKRMDGMEIARVLWIAIPSTILGCIVLGAIIWLVVRYVKHRRYQTIVQVLEKPDKESLLSHRKRVSLQKKFEREEFEREMIIQKSLASRASTQMSQQPPVIDERESDSESDILIRDGSGEEWKEHEAGIAKALADSCEDSHPALQPAPLRISKPSPPLTPPFTPPLTVAVAAAPIPVSVMSEIPLRKPLRPPRSAHRPPPPSHANRPSLPPINTGNDNSWRPMRASWGSIDSRDLSVTHYARDYI
jgi:hypothetical protein